MRIAYTTVGKTESMPYKAVDDQCRAGQAAGKVGQVQDTDRPGFRADQVARLWRVEGKGGFCCRDHPGDPGREG